MLVLSPSARMPKRQDLDLLRIILDAVLEVVPNTPQVKSSDAGQLFVRRRRTDKRLSRQSIESALDVLAQRMRNPGTMLSPNSKPGESRAVRGG